MITVSIDVTKLDKTRFFKGKPDQNGNCPIYADLTLWERKEVGKFGETHLVKQSKKKDETVEMPIIGRATERSRPRPQAERTETTTIMSEEVPF